MHRPSCTGSLCPCRRTRQGRGPFFFRYQGNGSWRRCFGAPMEFDGGTQRRPSADAHPAGRRCAPGASTVPGSGDLLQAASQVGSNADRRSGARQRPSTGGWGRSGGRRPTPVARRRPRRDRRPQSGCLVGRRAAGTVNCVAVLWIAAIICRGPGRHLDVPS